MSGKYARTSWIRYQYPGGDSFDAEGLAVHPYTGELFVVTKTRGATSYIYKMDPRFPERGPELVIEIDLAALFSEYGSNTNVRQITGMEISPDGTRFAIVTYEALVGFNLDLSRVYSRKLPGNTQTGICPINGDWWNEGTNIRRVQVESITYDANRSQFLIMGEGNAMLMAVGCPEY